MEESSDFKDNGKWNVIVFGFRISVVVVFVDLKIRWWFFFFVVNIFLLVIFILVMNIVVFLFLVEFGERVFFLIIGFLVFMVFIIILMD